MTYIRSWRFWVIVLLALTTLACAGRGERRERREQAREDRRERMEQRRAERQERQERQRAERRQGERQEAAAEPAPPQQQQRQSAAASFTPVSAAAGAAASDASSKIIFMRVSKQSSSVNAMLFDVSEPGAPKYIGTIGSASKLSYPLSPGIYTFMAVGETAEFMQATVVAGKTYYALVIPRANATRYAIEPVRQHEIGGKEFTSWDRGTKMAGSSPQSYNAADVAEKRQRYWPEWGRKSESQRAELTLNAEDGK